MSDKRFGPRKRASKEVIRKGHNGFMDEHTLDKLQFSDVRELLTEYCGGALGRGLAARIRPSTSPGMVKRWLDQLRELQTVSDEVGLPPVGAIHDIRPQLADSAKPAGVEADRLADVASSLAGTGVLRRWGESLPQGSELLRKLMERVGDLTPIARCISEAIDDRGTVRDDASPRLASIRATIERAKQQTDVVFRRLLKQSSITRFLQYANPTIHNDRKVLPLKAEHRGRINGIIHRSSDSGSTLFVEPTEAVELNNTIVRLGMDEDKEVSRILGDLSRLVHANADEIEKTLGAVAVFDLLSAKVKFAKDYDARVPEIDDDGSLEFRDARHVLLERLFRRQAQEGSPKREVVPIDVRLGDDFDILIITGPNTGGKTVAIKTVGLLVLMVQSGIPIPVGEGSRTPIFRKLFVDIGDEQSIEQSLSTFSSHLSNLLDILKKAASGSLVLIDELGSGTDPDEGAAIGRAIIDELVSLKASAIITTHLSVLKAVAFTEDRIDNASVEFDVETLKPLYRLLIGEPGNSNALIVAERLGMPHKMVQRAKSHLAGRLRALSQAISGTLQSRRKAEQARRDATEAKLEAEALGREMAEKQRKLDQAREAHERWVSWLNALREGDEVFVRSFERSGKIVRMQFQKQTALVAAGTLDFEVRLQELLPPQPE